ncbi:MAG TPA: hypothetical protein VGG19_13480 [Tepidisphaeraceae bacterium]|jgi:hydrogenase maturation protease
MNRAVVDKIANAVLYEGYVLYPYRPSVKNKQRWTFGGIYPQAWTTSHNASDPCLMQTECLLEGPGPTVHIIVRFLQLIDRTVGQLSDQSFHPVPFLEIAGKRYQPWQEAIEREIDLGEFSLADLLATIEQPFCFLAEKTEEILRAADNHPAGILWRRRESIQLSICMSAQTLSENLSRLTITITNQTSLSPSPADCSAWSRDEVLLRALVSTHTILGIRDGEFISLTDPPSHLKQSAQNCQNIGAWPVLVGTEPARDTILSSPIILSDYPEIAPESPGDLFDGLEIDEILTLRIMTLTDEEKKNAAATDERVGQLLQRTESLARQQMMNLHGAIRGMKPTAGSQP